MGLKKVIKILLSVFIILINIINMNISERLAFDRLEAEKLLKETYRPLENFTKELIVSEDEKLLLVPNYIKNEEDFINLFKEKMQEHNAKGFYKDLIVQKRGQLFVDGFVYIPSIYTKNGRVTRAYIKEKQKLISKLFGNDDKKIVELIIKEEWTISGEWHKRSNYYIKNQNGKWMLDHANGTSSYRFVDINNNPWRAYWKD
ncbi:hypothetical protein FQB35_03010 [Crassaminicella thermophila]|uniref:Uncharacterized protein n=1 Tax=Crassaminicella thermophila TaxID=2599308 RepID=A0A5C0SA34_CRATE|nr:hypothetical protein [Crassaminicella thermophila]QEK11423.1 hypothetical protein FQB35_03010 [Crassaminicella thermophila]